MPNVSNFFPQRERERNWQQIVGGERIAFAFSHLFLGRKSLVYFGQRVYLSFFILIILFFDYLFYVCSGTFFFWSLLSNHWFSCWGLLIMCFSLCECSWLSFFLCVLGVLGISWWPLLFRKWWVISIFVVSQFIRSWCVSRFTKAANFTFNN